MYETNTTHFDKKFIDELSADTGHPGLGKDGKYHVKADAHPLPEGTCLTYALVGNQNCGKTHLQFLNDLLLGGLFLSVNILVNL